MRIATLAGLVLALLAGPGLVLAQGPVATAARSLAGHPPDLAIDGDTNTAWRAPSSATSWLVLDFQQHREWGALTVLWEPRRYSTQYRVELSDDRRRWAAVYLTQGGNGGSDYLYLPSSAARYLRLSFLRSAGNGQGYGIRSITVQPPEWGASLDCFFHHVAAESPRGRYPRHLLGDSSAPVVGWAGENGRRSLLAADGAFQPFGTGFSLEPFLLDQGKLVTWADTHPTGSVEEGNLPLPSVEWSGTDVSLRVTAAAIRDSGQSGDLVRYRVTNQGSTQRGVTLALAIRPFPVTGGVSRIDSITGDTARVRVNDRVVQPLPRASRFGAASYDGGDITEFLSAGRMPLPKRVLDRFGHASGALVWELDLAPGGFRDVFVLVPGDREWPGMTAERAAQELVQRRLVE